MPGRKLTPAQNALIDKAIVREKEVIKVVKERAPLVETYIQNMKPDPVLLQVPESDEHFLARVDFGKVINDDEYKDNKGNFEAKKSKLSFFKNSFSAPSAASPQPAPHLPRVRLRPDDPDGLERTSTAALHLHLHPQRLPRQHSHRRLRRLAHQRQKEYGRFFGRIWVETATATWSASTATSPAPSRP
jgi:hypothetical protein